MESVRVYLAGGMSGISFDEQSKWRKQIQDAIKYGDYDCKKNPIFFDPTNYYSLFETEHKSEREVMEYDLYNLKRSDMVIVNFNVPNSIGTAMELAIAKENHMPVIGLNKDKFDLHPWVSECCTRVCDNIRELVEHVVNFYLK